jgi:hypothetical protein
MRDFHTQIIRRKRSLGYALHVEEKGEVERAAASET